MIYLTDDDLNAHIQLRLKDESQSDFENAQDLIEKQNIDFVKSHMIGRYDTQLVFSTATGVIKNDTLTKVLTKLVLYDLVRRNAARKVPSDYREDKEWAEEQLKRINAGKLILENLPKPKDENGNPMSTSMWGNLTNENFYL